MAPSSRTRHSLSRILTQGLALAAIFCAFTEAAAAPLYSSRVGGLALVGPASKHPASFFYNPGALGFLHGHHLYLDGMTTLQHRHATLRETNSESGAPTSRDAPGASSTKVAPQFFAAFVTDLGLDSLVIGVSVHTPTWERSGYGKGVGDDFFDGGAQGPTRYHGVEFSLFQLYVTLGAALRITQGWYIGFSTSYVYGDLRYAFVRDAALLGGATRSSDEMIALNSCGTSGQTCGFGNDRAAEAIRLSGSSNALGFAAGLIGRVHRDVDIGVGYVSALVGLGGSKIPSDGDAWIRRSEAVLENAQNTLGSVSRDLQGRSLVNYQLPDIVSAGVTWRARRRLTLGLQLRWMTYRRHDRLDIRLSGREFRQDPAIPQQLTHYRGFRDAFSGQLELAYRLTSNLLLQTAAMVESSAVAPEAATAIATEGWKLDTFVALRWWLSSGLSLRFGLGAVWVPGVSSDSSSFDPATLPTCVDARFDVDTAACKQAAAGRGLASSAGSYRALTGRFSIGIGYDWR